MAKLCPRGKAAAKRKFKVYPSAYANMYASAVCSGKVTPGGKKKRKKAMGGGVMDMTRMQYESKLWNDVAEYYELNETDIADIIARLEKKRISKGGNPDDSPLPSMKKYHADKKKK